MKNFLIIFQFTFWSFQISGLLIAVVNPTRFSDAQIMKYALQHRQSRLFLGRLSDHLCVLPSVRPRKVFLITARCTLVQSAVLRSHVVCLFVSPSVYNVGGLWSHRLEYIRPLVSLGCSLSTDPSIMGLLKGENHKIWAQSDPPPVDLSIVDIR